jgi:hypothetical protein
MGQQRAKKNKMGNFGLFWWATLASFDGHLLASFGGHLLASFFFQFYFFFLIFEKYPILGLHEPG